MADLKGLKRICMSCGARFYDLNKKPIICPNCNTEFTGEIKVKSRRGRLPVDTGAEAQVDEETEAENLAPEDDTEEVESDEETVSLEEIDEDGDDSDDDDDALDIDDDDLDIDDEDIDDLDDDDIEEDIAEEDEDK